MISSSETVQTTCCIAGGGPAGMMLGFLLARAGVEVVVLEKHADFLRDFRGDTVHPSTLELMYELGVLEDFLRRPHQELREVGALVEEFAVTVADCSHLPTHCKFVALMPQWDFLNFIAEKAKAYSQFHLRMEAAVTELLLENGRVAGVRANTPHGAVEVRADLVVGADGRHSIVREKAGLEVIDLGAPIDVLWMRIARKPDDPNQTLGRFEQEKFW
jgi:2-polyprenyl-6-methoxyphenol hydroxylase-like FAD-dependent oxidoreductase